MLVPRAALRRSDRDSYVWVVRDERAHRMAVTVGTELGDQVQIASGLAGGERLVVGDAAGVTDGGRVRVAEAAPQ